MPTQQQTEVDHDLSGLTRDQLESLYTSAFDALGIEMTKVKNLHAACHTAIEALANVDHSIARWSRNVLNKAIENNPR